MNKYIDMPENLVHEVALKKMHALQYRDMFGPTCRPGLINAAAYWNLEVERLIRKEKSLFEI